MPTIRVSSETLSQGEKTMCNLRHYIIKGFWVALLIGIMIMGCSDDDTPAGPSGTWEWSALGDGVNDRVFSLVEYDGNLIVGGYFTTAGGVAANNIAAWDGTDWSAMGSGMNDEVAALAVYDNKLFAGGTFGTANGVSAHTIASYDGSVWSALGDGTNGRIYALLVYDNKLVVGGDFDQAGGQDANNIAEWDGSAWSALGNGTDGPVHALAEYNGKLYAGGHFEHAGGVIAYSVAGWYNNTWMPLVASFDDTLTVFALLGQTDRMYVGGKFAEVGDHDANNIAVYRNSYWQDLGTLAEDRQVKCIYEFNGEVIVGGYNKNLSALDYTDYIAAYDGAEWHALGTGIDGDYYPHIWTCYEYNGSLIAGGRFDIAGTDSAANIAAWSFVPDK